MNKLSAQKRSQVVAALVEGSSVNSVVRMTGISKPTILKLLADLGTARAKYQDEKLRNLPCKRVQADEIWSFCFAKDKNLPEELKGKFGFGSVWTWTAICADTKLMVSWLVGERTTAYAVKFISDLASRLAHRVQLTTDGHSHIFRRLMVRSGLKLITRCLKRFIQPHHRQAQPRAIVRLNAAEPVPIKSWAIRIADTSPRAMRSG